MWRIEPEVLPPTGNRPGQSPRTEGSEDAHTIGRCESRQRRVRCAWSPESCEKPHPQIRHRLVPGVIWIDTSLRPMVQGVLPITLSGVDPAAEQQPLRVDPAYRVPRDVCEKIEPAIQSDRIFADEPAPPRIVVPRPVAGASGLAQARWTGLPPPPVPQRVGPGSGCNAAAQPHGRT